MDDACEIQVILVRFGYRQGSTTIIPNYKTAALFDTCATNPHSWYTLEYK